MAEKPAGKPGRDSYKRWFDLTILGLAHALALPIWALLWTFIPLLIWLGDRGPVFYKQKRVGMEGRAFTVLKFRTMVLDADRKGPAWTTDGDVRVTRVGRLLRRTGLDELPEILNIWKGEMSLVGPRALDVDEEKLLERQIPGFEGRLQVLPGLTGLAQVYDRTDDSLDKFRYDQEYLRRMGPWLDLKLLVLSLRNTLAARWDHRSGKPAEGKTESAALKTDARGTRTSKEASVKPGSRR
jgi:lipopolysaccharide/colanic/teichoic acid biosynthesis glycosyltransferase